MGGENWQQNAPQKWDCWAQCAPECDPCFLTWFKTCRQADGTWFWEGKKSQKITKWEWEKAKRVCVCPHHNRMRCTSKPPHFSVQHPLKAQTWPKASPKLYPVIILPLSNKRGNLDFFWQLVPDTTQVQNNFSPQRMWFPLLPPHPGSYQMVFWEKLMGCRQCQPSWAKGMLKLLLQWTHWTEKKTGKNNNYIPSKNSSKSFLVNCMSRNSFLHFILSKPSHLYVNNGSLSITWCFCLVACCVSL